jgi:hypothetical protein
MVLNHHGLAASLDGLLREVEIHPVGTYVPQLGSCLLRAGFDATVVTMNPGLFTRRDAGMSRDAMLARFDTLREKASGESRRLSLAYFTKFVRDGGEVRVKVPTPEDVAQEIAAGRPVIALLTTWFLDHAEPAFNSHFNVITGIDGRHVHVNDPLGHPEAGRLQYPVGDYFFGLYASAHGDPDNASLLLASPRRPSA